MTRLAPVNAPFRSAKCVGPQLVPKDQVVAAYQQHHNEHRPHQARNQPPPGTREQPAATDIGTRRLLRTRVLGGLINEYRYAACPASTTPDARRSASSTGNPAV